MAARTGFLTAGNARLHFRDIGEGPPIVVLHGGPDFDYDYLLPELDRLAEGFRVIYYDQRGRGRSADGVRPDDVTIESEMDDLDHVRRHFGLESMAVLGHSWGGVLALEYAGRRPERLTHLVLMNTAPASHQDVQAFRQHLGRIRPAGDTAAMQSLAATAEFRTGDLDVESEYYRIHYRPALRAPELLDRLVPRLRTNFTPERVVTARAIEDRLYDQTWLSPGWDLLPKLRRLAVPTLVLHGENDFVPVDLAAHVAAAIPAARLVVLRQCGHFAYLEAPDAVVRHVRELFEAAPAAPAPRPANSGSAEQLPPAVAGRPRTGSSATSGPGTDEKPGSRPGAAPGSGPGQTAAVAVHYRAPGWLTRNVVNRAVAFLTRYGVSIRGSRVLAVRGRTSGAWRTTPVNLLDHQGHRYLVSPRGQSQWVRNLRAAGTGELRVGKRAEAFRGRELSDEEKVPVLRAYLERWKLEVGMFFEGVGPDSGDAEIRAIAAKHPAFEVLPAG